MSIVVFIPSLFAIIISLINEVSGCDYPQNSMRSFGEDRMKPLSTYRQRMKWSIGVLFLKDRVEQQGKKGIFSIKHSGFQCIILYESCLFRYILNTNDHRYETTIYRNDKPTAL